MAIYSELCETYSKYVASYIDRVGGTAYYKLDGKSVLLLQPSKIHMLEKLKVKKVPIHFNKPRKELASDLGYPCKLLDWSFNWKSTFRGLVLDKKKGNIFKMDHHKNVKVAYKGFKGLSKEDNLGPKEILLYVILLMSQSIL